MPHQSSMLTCAYCGGFFLKSRTLSSKITPRFCCQSCYWASLRTPFTPEFFWSMVARTDQIDQCWIWTGAWTGDGYGCVNINKQRTRAHRVAYELTYGPIPDGWFVCHKCDNPPCCNPHHLFAGTPADNMHDRSAKWRQPHGMKAKSAKLTDDQVREIRHLAASGLNNRAIADRYGVDRTTISLIVLRKHWKHIP